MSLPVALPSPPRGHPAIRHILALRWRTALARGITREPGDELAYFAAGSVLFTWGIHAANALFGLDPLNTFTWLTGLRQVPVWTLVAVGQLLGFASRSATARTIATLSASLFAVGIVGFYVPMIPSIVGEVASWAIRSATVAATVLWSVRTLRRWLITEAPSDE